MSAQLAAMRTAVVAHHTLRAATDAQAVCSCRLTSWREQSHQALPQMPVPPALLQ